MAADEGSLKADTESPVFDAQFLLGVRHGSTVGNQVALREDAVRSGFWDSFARWNCIGI